MNMPRTAIASSRVLCTRVGDEMVLLDPVQGVYYGLNPVGARVWQLLAEGLSPAQIAEAIPAEFEVEGCAFESDLFRLLTDLNEKGLIELSA